MKYVKTVDEAFEFVKGIVELAEKRANDAFPKIQKLNDIKNAPITQVYVSNTFTFDSYYSRNQPFTTLEQVDKRLAEYQIMLDENIKSIEETHALNIPLIENNKLVREKITVVMQHIGIPNNYSTSEFKSARSSKKTTTTHAAGWYGDLNRNCLTDDFYQSKITAAKSAFENLKKKAQDEKTRILKEKQEKDKEEKSKKSVRALAVLQVKYGLDENSDWSDVLEAFDSKDKYFMLARAMEDVRNDWNDGFGRVEWALGKFVVETEEDKEIEECIQNILESEESDGRVFRDTQYNYSELYAKVDIDLMSDYSTLQEYYERY